MALHSVSYIEKKSYHRFNMLELADFVPSFYVDASYDMMLNQKLKDLLV